MGLESRERATLVKACAVLGGIEAKSIRTVARSGGWEIGEVRNVVQARRSVDAITNRGKGREGERTLFN